MYIIFIKLVSQMEHYLTIWFNTGKRIPIYPDVNTFGEDKRLRYVVDSHAGLTDLFITSLRREYQQQKDQPEKPSVREKLQATVKTTSPKISAKKKTLER